MRWTNGNAKAQADMIKRAVALGVDREFATQYAHKGMSFGIDTTEEAASFVHDQYRYYLSRKASKNPRDRFEIKDAQYARRLKSGQWPSDTCQDCKRGACCKRDWHHSGDVCSHCGQDEREDGKMKFRKNGKKLIARWESKSGKYFVDLFSHEDGGYSYSTVGGGGMLGILPSDAAAITTMAKQVNIHQPDANKTPMQRVEITQRNAGYKRHGDRVDFKETVDGWWMVTIDGIQWGPTGALRDRSGASSATWPTKREAVKAFDEAQEELRREARKYRNNPPRPIKSDLEKVLKALDLPPNADALIEKNQEFIWESARFPDEFYRDHTEAEIEEATDKADQAVTESIYKAWKNAIEEAIEHVAQETGLGIQLDWAKGTAGIFCDDWEKCARVIWKIIEGVGYSATGSTLKEELAINSCNTARQYVQKYWFVVRERADVYGGTSIKRVYEKALESNLRNL